MTNTCRRGVN